MHAITGAFGYTGKHIAHKLLAQGAEVITLTGSPQRQNPFGGRVRPFPFSFDQPERLTETLRGVEVLYNTYWVRFERAGFSFDEAVRNTMTLFECARRAGVRRVVHVSITNPSEDSPLGYFRGKARLERALRESGLSHAILSPTVIFGHEDILINNIAWALRRLPVFGVFGDGNYRLQPIHVDDMAELAIAQGRAETSVTIDAIGPETYTYRELVATVGRLIGRPRPVVGVPPALGYVFASLVGRLVGDVMLTREEIAGLMADLLYTASPPAGPTRLSAWIKQHAERLGQRYTSELARRRDRQSEYAGNY